MIFEYDGKKFAGKRTDILKQIESYFILTIKNGNVCLGLEIYPIFDRMDLDTVRKILLLRLQKKVPVTRTAIVVNTDYIEIRNNLGILIKRINIHDI